MSRMLSDAYRINHVRLLHVRFAGFLGKVLCGIKHVTLTGHVTDTGI